MELVRKQTYITAEQDRRLKEAAGRYGTTEAEVLRRALERWLDENETDRAVDPFAGIIGFVDGPRKVDHDDIYR